MWLSMTIMPNINDSSEIINIWFGFQLAVNLWNQKIIEINYMCVINWWSQLIIVNT